MDQEAIDHLPEEAFDWCERKRSSSKSPCLGPYGISLLPFLQLHSTIITTSSTEALVKIAGTAHDRLDAPFTSGHDEYFDA